MEKESYYFPHFCNARHDRKIKRLMKELGLEGYGIFFMLLEVLREQTDFKYPIQDIDLLADEFGTSEQKLRVVICNYQLFEIVITDDKEMFLSPKLLVYLQPYFRIKEQRRIAGQKSGEARKIKALENKNNERPFNDRSTDDKRELNEIEQSKVNESKVNESNIIPLPVEEIPYKEIIDYLNKAIGASYKHTSGKTKECIHARWNEGFRLNDFKKVIDNKVYTWNKEPRPGERDMREYLRPITLFGTKFESYLNEKVQQQTINNRPKIFRAEEEFDEEFLKAYYKKNC